MGVDGRLLGEPVRLQGKLPALLTMLLDVVVDSSVPVPVRMHTDRYMWCLDGHSGPEFGDPESGNAQQ
jgi:hypothetical protein